MPPNPGGPRKPAGPARHGQSSLPSAQKPVNQPAPARPAAPARSFARSSSSHHGRGGVRLHTLVWWGLVLAVAVLVIAGFEFGYSCGEKRMARLRAEVAAEFAAANRTPASTPTPPPPETKTSATETPAHKTTPAREDRPTASVESPKKTTPAKPPTTTPAKEEPAKTTEPAKAPDTTVVLKFEKDILPVFQAKCISCHGNLSKKGGLDLRSLGSIARGGNSGPGIKPGKPEDSPVWQTVKSGDMPPRNKPQLTADEKQLIAAWIAGGAR